MHCESKKTAGRTRGDIRKRAIARGTDTENVDERDSVCVCVCVCVLCSIVVHGIMCERGYRGGGGASSGEWGEVGAPQTHLVLTSARTLRALESWRFRRGKT
jgi:hypothetical protein